MSLIKNLVAEKPNKDKKTGNDDEEDKPLRPFIKTATDLQRLKLEKLMKNPDKPVVIPEQRREKDYMATVPTFVRNVMGSSAGAGSGEFHVYRHLRRKEYARQKTIQAQSAREQANDAYQQKLDDNKRTAEERTAKKRAKRLKKKQNAKRTREHKPMEVEKPVSESSDESEEEVEQAVNTPKEQPVSNENEADQTDEASGQTVEPVEQTVEQKSLDPISTNAVDANDN